MLSTVLSLIALTGTVQKPIDFQLGWKKGDKFTYYVSTGNSQRSMVDSSVELSVTGEDEKGFTVSTSRIEFTETRGFPMRPIPAGTMTFSQRGKLTSASGSTAQGGSAGVYFMFVALPEKAVSVGDEFQVSMQLDGVKAEFSGKFVSLEGPKKNLAKFEFSGQFTDADGNKAPITLKTTFDTDRKIYVSHSASWHGGGIVHSFKLKEPAEQGWTICNVIRITRTEVLSAAW